MLARNQGGPRISNRDEEFRDFYFQQASRLKRLGLVLTADPVQADDLAQEALLRAYRSWDRIRDEDPGPYVRTTLINLYRTLLRRKIVERKHLQVAKAEPTPSHDHGIEQTMMVAAALRCLSPIRRATVVLRFYEDFTQAEIARILDRPVGTVKSDLHRALSRLRPLLDDARRPHPRSQAFGQCATG